MSIEMNPQLSWLDDPKIFRVNQIPAHSDHKYFSDEASCLKGEETLMQCLDGEWHFTYSKNAASRPADFYKEDFDDSGFDRIKVPCHIEMADFDRIHYTNTVYPWEGYTFRRPAYTGFAGSVMEGMFSKAEYNPVGSYICHFDLNEELKGKKVRVCFEGAEQAIYVWLNGAFLGYAEDTFTPSEFDLTPYIKDEGNKLAVEVHKRSKAAFLEDQDFFRFSGLYRSVKLYAQNDIHMEDLWIRPEITCVECGKAVVNVDMKFAGPAGSVKVAIKDQGRVVAEAQAQTSEKTSISVEMPEKIRMWDNHDPYMYTFEAVVTDEAGNVTEIVPYKFGFRKLELKKENNMVCLNGKRLYIVGVNRHEWSARGGRCITLEDMKADMAVFKKNNINSVRTCHYPNQIPWYYMCDEEGIYMMSETNLEAHGSWQKMNGLEPSWNVPGSVSEWDAITMDRAITNFETFKNHTSILFWSLGNESYCGTVTEHMNRYFKETDPSRMVHYESSFYNRDFEDTISDFESRMYPQPEEIVDYIENNGKKPYILCEYMHDMGNSLGGMKSYMDCFDKYPSFVGGYIWDYMDQALFVTDEVTGEEVLRYGGDFDDRPSDYEFSGNGIVFADRSEKPAMQEVRYYYGLYR